MVYELYIYIYIYDIYMRFIFLGHIIFLLRLLMVFLNYGLEYAENLGSAVRDFYGQPHQRSHVHATTCRPRIASTTQGDGSPRSRTADATARHRPREHRTINTPSFRNHSIQYLNALIFSDYSLLYLFINV